VALKPDRLTTNRQNLIKLDSTINNNTCHQQVNIQATKYRSTWGIADPNGNSNICATVASSMAKVNIHRSDKFANQLPINVELIENQVATVQKPKSEENIVRSSGN